MRKQIELKDPWNTTEFTKLCTMGAPEEENEKKEE